MTTPIPSPLSLEDDVDRIDHFLAEHFSLSRSAIQKQLKAGMITSNGRVLKASASLAKGTVIHFQGPLEMAEEPQEEPPLEDICLDIVFEDEAVIVLNKPAGLVVHPGVKTQNTLLHALLAHCPSLQSVGEVHRSGIVHRLDRETEGLMVVAKTEEAYQSLVAQFKNRSVEKAYYAMVYGELDEDVLHIDQPIGRHRKYRIKYSVSEAIQGSEKEAITDLRVLKRYGTKSLLELRPKTGRTHQLRVHMQSVGFPILGDPLYGPKKGKNRGQLLQSFYLAFDHPVSNKRLCFERDLSSRLTGKYVVDQGNNDS